MALSRRDFLRNTGILAAAAALPAIPWQGLASAASREAAPAHQITSGLEADAVFPQSVCSGDPTTTGAIVWTRIAPDAVRPGVDIGLQVSENPAFKTFALRSTIPADQLRSEAANTVRVDLDGLLLPGRTYYYRFIYDGTATRTGRCRTLPHPTKPLASVKFAVLSCQNYQNGHFTALGSAAQDDVDFLLHLGDFIYEYSGDASYNGKTFPGRGVHLPSGAPRMQSRADLDAVWGRYRSDPNLMRALERHTLIATWDDHEVANDRYYDHAAQRHYGDSSFALNDDAAACEAFFRDGAQAYYDWMPLRIQVERDAADPLDVIRLYRSFRFGSLLELFLLDERWYRSKQLAELTSPSPESVTLLQEKRVAPDQHLLGPDQLAWFTQGLRASPATWKAVGNGVQFTPLGLNLPGASVYVNLDAWDGYENERQSVTQAMGDAGNVVVLTGDLHTFLAGYVKPNYGSPDAPRVAVEFMAGGVTSAGIGEIVEQATGKPAQPGDDELFEEAVLAGNPHLVLFNSHRHGYGIAEFTPSFARLSCFVVDKANPLVEGNKRLLAVYEVPRDRVELLERYRASPTGSPLVAAGAAHSLDPRRGTPTGSPVVARSLEGIGPALRQAAQRPATPSVVPAHPADAPATVLRRLSGGPPQ